jgi:mercuric reductase
MNNIIELKIKGMTCDSCASHVSKALASVNGVETVKINGWKSGHATVSLKDSIDSDALVAAVKKAGYNAEVDKSFLTEEGKNSFPGNDLIIIGGGSAAFAAAIRASELEKKTLMINEGLPIGGTCVNVGCVPSKTLIRTAEAFHNTNHTNFESIKTGGSKLDFKTAIKQKTELVESLRQKKYIGILSTDENVKIIEGRGKLTGKNSVTVNGVTYTSKYILIAAGSSTVIPDIPGLNTVPYLTNDSLYELEELPQHIIIIGGRYIALENAQLLARLGAKVTILQRSNRILPNEMPDITQALTKYLNQEGVEIKTGVKLQSVEKANDKIVVKADIEGNGQHIEGTHLLIASGRKGNAKGLDLEELEINTFGNGFIKTDEFLKTNVSNIFCAGDITGQNLFVYTAAYEGKLAVDNMFSGKLTAKNYNPLPWVIFTDPQVAGVGHDENSADVAGIDYDVSTVQLTDIPRSLAARNTKGFIKLIRNKADDTLIGARILASEGSELLMEVSLAIKFGIKVSELRQMFHPYLALSEGIKIAAIGFDKDVKKLSCCAV